MGKSTTLSLGTDNIGKLLLSYATPSIIAMASSSLYHIADSAFVGHGVGDEAISAMAITMPIMNIGAAFGAMVGVGAGARISLRLGEGNKRAAEKTLANAILLNIVIGLTIMTLMLTFLDDILALFISNSSDPTADTAKTIELAKEYIRVILCGNVITHLYLGMNDMVRASGYPQRSMGIMLTAIILNLILDYIFVFPLGWGISGAAWATVIAQFVAFLIATSHFSSKHSFIRFKRDAFHFDRKIVGSILSIGLAPFLMNICASTVAIFVMRAMFLYGGTGADDIVQHTEADESLYAGAYGIANRVVLLFIMVIQGLNQGMQPIVGYNYGARNFGRVRKALFMTIGAGITIATIGFIAAQFFPDYIARIFIDKEKDGTQMIEIATQGLRLMTIMFPLVGFQIVAGGFFQYIGKAPLAITTSLTRQLLFLVPLLWILPRTFGAYGVWISMPIADAASILLAFIFFIWQMRKLRREEQALSKR